MGFRKWRLGSGMDIEARDRFRDSTFSMCYHGVSGRKCLSGMSRRRRSGRCGPKGDESDSITGGVLVTGEESSMGVVMVFWRM